MQTCLPISVHWVKLPIHSTDQDKDGTCMGGIWPLSDKGFPGPVRKIVSAVKGCVFNVCLCPQWQVLNKAKSHIQELEGSLDNLLKLKGKRPLPREGCLRLSIAGRDMC